jgi:hypothetical protein
MHTLHFDKDYKNGLLHKHKMYYEDKIIFPSFKIIRRFDFSIYISFSMYLDIVYIYVHCKNYVSRKTKIFYNLERIKYINYDI